MIFSFTHDVWAQHPVGIAENASMERMEEEEEEGEAVEDVVQMGHPSK